MSKSGTHSPSPRWLLALPLLVWSGGCRPAPQAAPPIPAPQVQVAEFVRTQKGNMPIVISAPHGGGKAIPGAPPRTGEGMVKGGAGFSTARDGGTEELAFELAAEVERVTGHKPYLVVGSYLRTYLDCNRPPSIAYASPSARLVYEAYHGALQADCKEILAQYGGGLVVDLHGQGSSAVTVYRGTKNGASVTRMRRQFGEGIHEGPESFLGRLKALGWIVHPEPGGREQTGYTGGFITQTYGSEAAGTDAIQLEFGATYRSTEEQRKATAQALAKVIAEMAKLYHR